MRAFASFKPSSHLATACKAKSTQPRASEAAPWVRTSDVTTPCKGKSIHNQQDAQLYFCPFRAPAHARHLTQGAASLALGLVLTGLSARQSTKSSAARQSTKSNTARQTTKSSAARQTTKSSAARQTTKSNTARQTTKSSAARQSTKSSAARRASAQVTPTEDIVLPRIPHAHDAHASLLAPVIVPRAQQRGSFHAPFLAMAEPKQASLCSFGLTKRLSLFRSAAYLPLVLKLFHVVKVVFVVLKIYSISVCPGRCCTIAPCMRERFHPVYGQGCGKAALVRASHTPGVYIGLHSRWVLLISFVRFCGSF